MLSDMLNSWWKSCFWDIVWFEISDETVGYFPSQATGMLKDTKGKYISSYASMNSKLQQPISRAFQLLKIGLFKFPPPVNMVLNAT